MSAFVCLFVLFCLSVRSFLFISVRVSLRLPLPLWRQALSYLMCGAAAALLCRRVLEGKGGALGLKYGPKVVSDREQREHDSMLERYERSPLRFCCDFRLRNLAVPDFHWHAG